MKRILMYVGYQSKPFSGASAVVDGVGGSEYAAIEISENLVKRGYVVDVVGDVLTTTFKGVNYIEISKFKDQCLTQYRNSKYDTVIAVNYINYLIELPQYVQFTQSVFWMHNHEPFPWYRGSELSSDRIHELFSDSRMTVVVATSDSQAKILGDKYPIAEKLKIISNGIKLELFPNVRKTNTSNRFIYSSAPDRGLVTVLKMWNRVRAIFPDATLSIYCPPYAQKSLEDITTRYNAYSLPGVNVVGAVSQRDLYQAMFDSTFWLYPSTYDETFCITALEMMYARNTIISTNSANLKDILRNRAYLVDSTLSEDEIIEESLQYLQTISLLDRELMLNETYPHHAFAASQTWANQIPHWDSMLGGFTVSTFIDRAYVISLHPNDPIVYQKWKDRLNAAGVFPKSIEMWPAVNGNDVNQQYLDSHNYKLFKWKQPDSSNSWFNRDMKPGEIGCAISHYTLWKHIETVNEPFITNTNTLILEDDFINTNVQLTDDTLANLPIYWDMIYLGRNPLTDEQHPNNSKIVVPGRSYNMHAYVLSKTGVIKLMQQQFQKKIMPVDEFIQATYTTHIRPDLHHIWADSKVYAVRHDVLKQDGTKSETENLPVVASIPIAPTYNQEFRSRLYPELYTYFEDPNAWMKKFLIPGVVDKQWDLVVDEPIPHVYCVKFFNEDFCNKIQQEAEHVGKWTTDRHEFYPTTDMLLAELGFNDIFDDLICKLIMPMAINRFQLDGKCWGKMSSENFIAKYTPDTQAQLAIHFDASDITALVNLSKPDIDFEGGGTWFPKYQSLYRPPQGSVSVHPGNITHKHGARVVTKGSRFIMVAFMNRFKP